MKEVILELPSEKIQLQGILTVPEGAKTIVVFAHGSGSSRFSPRNQFVANILVKRNLATLLLDLLTPEEEEVDLQTREHRFNISLLAKRLSLVAKWMSQQAETKGLRISYFGSSTGAAAALIAAAEQGSQVAAVVSRGGRPDLASAYLPKVKAPTLFLVGGNDFGVIELNQQAFDLLTSEKKLTIVPGATHLFEEPGTLEEVARLAADWFQTH
jgi:putative phosphoribosyl transferase